MLLDALHDPVLFLTLTIGLLAAITVHEFAHAVVADRFGDPTPRLHGRVTLNPLAHLDPIGTLTLLLFRFGWGKPVPVDSRHFNNPLLDEIQVSLAGPLANLALAVAIGFFYRLIPLPALGREIAVLVVQMNLVLMIFNLLPIPPLDGSRLLRIILSDSAYAVLEQFGTIILLGIFLIGGNLITQLYTVTVIPLAAIILGSGS